MKVLLTGAMGNLGIMTVQSLLTQGHDIRCLDIGSKKNRQAAKTLPKNVEVVWGDIRNDTTLGEAVKGIEAVIHLAAVLPPMTENHPELAQAINVEGTQKLLSALKKTGSSAFVVYASSVTVFGLQQHKLPPRKINEPLSPIDNYTRHKVACENMLQKSGLPWTVLRLGVSVDSRTTATDLQTFRKLFSVHPENRLEYVHPKDVATALAKVISCQQAQGKVLLIGGGESCQIKQNAFLSSLFAAVGIKLPSSIHGQQAFYTDWMDTRESQALLSYQQVSFMDYQQEMKNALRFVRWLLWPLRPIILLLLKILIKP